MSPFHRVAVRCVCQARSATVRLTVQRLSARASFVALVTLLTLLGARPAAAQFPPRLVPANSSVTVAPAVQRTDTIFAYNDNSATQFSVDAPACTGNLTNCSATPTPGKFTNVAAGSFLRVIVKYTAGAVGAGNLQIVIHDNNTGLQATASINVTANGTLTVTPKTNNRTTINAGAQGSYTFSVTNTATVPATISISGSCAGQVSCSYTPISRSFAASEVYQTSISFTGSGTGGTGYARISATTTGASDFAEDTVTVNPPPPVYGVSVTLPGGNDLVQQAGSSQTAAFAVTNTSNVPVTFNVSWSCQPQLTCTSASGQTSQLNPQASQSFNVGYTVGSTGTNGTVQFTATGAGAASSATTTTTLRVSAPSTTPTQPDVTPDNQNVTASTSVANAQQQFNVRNTSTTTAATFNLSWACSGSQLTCGGTSTLDVAPNTTKPYVVTYSTGSATGSAGTVTLTATSGTLTDNGSVNVTLVNPPLSVTPKNQNVQMTANWQSSQPFIVTNRTGGTESYTATPLCQTVTCISATPSSFSLSSGLSQTVGVRVGVGTPGSAGYIKLAVTAGAGAKDTGSVNVTAVASTSAPLTVTPKNATATVIMSQQNTYTFQVKNGTLTSDTYTLTPSCSGVTGCSVSPTSLTVMPDSTRSAVVTFTAGGSGTTGTVKLIASTSAGADTGSVNTTAAPPPSMAIYPPTGQVVTQPSWVNTSQVYTVTWTGASAAFTVARSCSGLYVTCTAVTTTKTFQTNVADTVQITYDTHGPPPNNIGGSLLLKVTGAGRVDSSLVDVRVVTPQVAVSISPDTVRPAPGTTQTATFTVSNPGGGQSTYSLSATCSSATCTLSKTSATVPGYGSTTVGVTYVAGTAGTTGTATLTASTTGASASRTLTIIPSITPPPTKTVAVTPQNAGITLTTGQGSSTVFTITNNGSAASFRYTVACPANVTGCTANSAAGSGLTGQTGSLAGNGAGQFTITVSYTGGSTLTTSPLTVKAEDLANAANNWDIGTLNVTVANTPPLTVASRALGIDGSVARDACLDMPLGKGASYECGDIRFAYSLPTMTSMNRPRQLTLLYLSSQANASAVIEADVSMNASQTPTQIVPRLTIKGTTYTLSALPWNPAWPANQPRRITIGVDGIAMALTTGVYKYVLEISETTSGATQTKSDSGYVTIVDRSKSEIGRGWWVEGIEQLVTVNATQKLWIGGDGSTRLYTQTANANIYTVASPLNRPDTLEWTGSFYKRHLPNGAYTGFNTGGLHDRTVNALGQLTQIHHDGNGRIYAVQLPQAGNAGGPMWQFSYQSSNDNTGIVRLESIHLQGTGVVDRPTFFSPLPTGWIATIQYLSTGDAEWSTAGGYTRFAYSPDLSTSPTAATRDLVGITNPRGYVTRFGYVAGKLRADTVVMTGSGMQDIINTFCPAETRGRNSACSPTPEALANAVTFVDGPRTNVGDTTKFYINRYGAPDTVVNAQGQATILTRSTPFPLLPTSVVQPNGFTTKVFYNGRGLVDSTLAINPLGDGQNALTQYKWHAIVNQPIKVTAPLGDTASADYRSDGQPLWRYSDGVRVTFNYASSCTNQLSSAVYPDASKDSLAYDTSLCNLATSIAPLHPATTYLRDAVGRVIRTMSPIDSLGTQMRTDTVSYTARDLVLRSKSYYGTDSLLARNEYDLDGNLITSIQKAYPRLARFWYPYSHPNVDSLVHVYSYDPTDRLRSEASGPYSWTLSYDEAGNLTSGKDYGRVDRTYDELNRLAWQKGSDTNNLRYDPRMGWLVAADNQNAQVRRSYYPNGAIKTDTLRIQKEGATAPDFSAHEYVVSYTYDLNGRRKTVTNHLGNVTTYNYDVRTGDLASVVDVAGLTHRFHYDAMARLDTLVRMSGRADSVVETHTFDLASRLRRRLIQQTGRSLALYDDALQYDGRDKVIRHNSDVLGYAPLGQLVLSQMAAFSTTPEQFGTDALGMHKWRTTQYKPSNTNASTTMTDTIYYAPGSSIINASVAWKDSGSPDTTLYTIDFLGNQNGSENLSRTDIEPTTPEWVNGVHQRYGYRRNTLSQYNNENRLMFFRLQKDTIWVGSTESAWYTATETYKYDALGRRVWVRSIKPNTCWYNDLASGCHSSDTRTIWDGSELLAEERSFPIDDTTAADYANGSQYGTVQYSHVGVIDQPITVVTGAAVLLPYADWRGAIDKGTCASATTCPSYIFPGGISSSYRSNFFKRQGSPNWYGSLTEGQTDASELQYKRNRYYDPVAGTFTQEDPIGISGGYNTYAYTGGDPVNYSDPLGLCKEPDDPCPNPVERMLSAVDSKLHEMYDAAGGQAIEITAQIASALSQNTHGSVDVVAGPVVISFARDATSVDIAPSIGLAIVGTMTMSSPGSSTGMVGGGALIGEGLVGGASAKVGSGGRVSGSVSVGAGVTLFPLPENSFLTKLLTSATATVAEEKQR